LPGILLTIDVFRPIQVDPEYPPVREGYDEDVVRDLRGHKVGGDGELELHLLEHKYGEPVAVLELEVRHVGFGGGHEAVV
jgi:hypothetical protein